MEVQDMYSVYLIECHTPNHFYVGMTWDLKRRISQHRCGAGSLFTKLHGFKSYKVVWDELSKEEALSVERKTYRILKKQGLEVRGGYNCSL